MEMRNLLFGVILGLLAVVHSTPVDNVTHFPTKPDDDVLKEVLEDGYLVHEMTPRVLTTNPPRTHQTVQPSQQPLSASTNPEVEGSAETNAESSTTPTVKQHDTGVMNATQSENSTSAQEPGETSSASTTTQSSQPKFLPSSVPPRAPSTPVFTNQTNDIKDSSGDLMGNGSYGSGSGSGSGSGDMQDFVTIARETSSSDTNKNTSSSFPVGEGLETEPGKKSESDKSSDKESDKSSDKESDKSSDKESDKSSDKESDKSSDKESDKSSDKESDKSSDKESDKSSDKESDTKSGSKKSRMFGTSITEMATQQQGHDKVILNDQTPKADTQHRTPGWIIIVAFIVGLAALVMLCVAIATRDKWNGPHKASQLETKTSSSDQQREQEMTTFVHNESPRENGKAAEYTVIPLDELPEDYSSH